MRGLREGWTRHPWEWLLLLALLALLVGFALAPHARGDYREIKIRELKPNDIVMENGFVELQMYSSGQGDISGHYLRPARD